MLVLLSPRGDADASSKSKVFSNSITSVYLLNAGRVLSPKVKNYMPVLHFSFDARIHFATS